VPAPVFPAFVHLETLFSLASLASFAENPKTVALNSGYNQRYCRTRCYLVRCLFYVLLGDLQAGFRGQQYCDGLIVCKQYNRQRDQAASSPVRQSAARSEHQHAWTKPMSEGDLHEEIARLEAEIDEHAAVTDRCQKLGAIAKSAIGVGATLLLGFTVGLIGLGPVALISAMAAVIGGIVVFGSNASTLKQAAANIKDAEARRAELIGMIDLRPVGEKRDRRLGLHGPDPQ
jgi:hypothetical protein